MTRRRRTKIEGPSSEAPTISVSAGAPYIIQPIPPLPVSRRGIQRWWLSAIVYLLLCAWLGIHLATALIVVVGAGTLWWKAACRWPGFAVFTMGFVSGLIGGRRSRR